MATGDRVPSGTCPFQPRKLERAWIHAALELRKETGAWVVGGAASRRNPALRGVCLLRGPSCRRPLTGNSSHDQAVRGVMSRGVCLYILGEA